ncbi:MAG: hypothetical protein F4X56_01145 [Gammaproteobacteria bacterium]|nr:hypothetical protein [Gammaproteobacteria bacterium]MYC24507.1 hypothetical protein [Gammaproteobacteria bacterium]
MRRGSPESLEFTTRHGQLSAQHAIQDIFDAVVELVTNCDDSYHNQFRNGLIDQDGGYILLEIEPHRKDSPATLTVRDRASGFQDLSSKLSKVGNRTSKTGDRGFMARGLKDCAALGHVTVETIVDGIISKAEITSNFEYIPWIPEGKREERATSRDRKRLGIRRGNGTVVQIKFLKQVKVPRVDTLRRDLPLHYALRDIMMEDGTSQVSLRHSNSRSEHICFRVPKSTIIVDREYEIPRYEGVRARFRLYKASSALQDPSDPRLRRTGILIKGIRGIYGCTFLSSELERDPASENYFGRIECEHIDHLAEQWDQRREARMEHPENNPTFILDPNRRNPLSEKHPFVACLYETPVEILKRQFEQDKREKERTRRQVESVDTTKRLKALARAASQFMRKQLEDLDLASPDHINDFDAFYRKGIQVSPKFTQIPVGDTRLFYVRAHKKIGLPEGSAVAVRLSKNADRVLEVLGKPTDLEPDPIHEDVLRGKFTLKGLRESQRVQITCIVGKLDPVFSEVQVIVPGPIELEIPNDLSFQRKEYTVRSGSHRILLLRARFDSGNIPAVEFKSMDSQVIAVRSHHEFRRVEGTTYYEAKVTVEGRRIGSSTDIVAEVGDRSSSCIVRAVEKEELGTELKFELVDYSLGDNFRAVWDRKQQNRLLITTVHESVSRYLGAAADNYPGQMDGTFRVLLAELIADNVCRRIVEEHARARPQEFDSDKVYVMHNRLMKEFTPLAHRIQLASPSVGDKSNS